MKKTLAQQLRTNIKMRMAELEVTGEQVYSMAGYKSRVGYNTRINRPEGITISDLGLIAKALKTTEVGLLTGQFSKKEG